MEPSQKPHIDNRHLLRQLIVQILYEKTFKSSFELIHFPDREVDIPDNLEFEKISPKTLKKVRKALPEAEETVKELLKNLEKIDSQIKEFAKSWPLEQINPVDLQIIRLAIFEGFIAESIPAKVAIDEAIELGKDFGVESNVKFISGVLGNIYNSKQDADK